MTLCQSRLAGLVILGAFAGIMTAETASAAEFYKGKTVTYIVATAAGGGYDFYGRLVAGAMQNYLPGSTFVVKNMPGAGHLIGANTIYNAKPDGLTLGTFNTGLIYSQLIGLEGVKFDLKNMSWIGKAASEPRALIIRSTSPIKSFQDLRDMKVPVNFAANGVGSAGYVETKMLADVLNLPIKIIAGYDGIADMMAMRREEVVGTIGARSTYEDFVNNGYGRFIAQIGGRDKDVPQLSGLITDPESKALVALIQSQGEISRLTAGPPSIPQDRLEDLRTAYRKAMEDKELQAKAEKVGRPVEPVYGDDLAKMVRGALDQSPKTTALLAKTLDIKEPIVKATGPLLQVEDKGRKIVFGGPDGQKVESIPSGSRTKITIAGKEAQRGELKAGMHCEISYKSGGDNEPATVVCK